MMFVSVWTILVLIYLALTPKFFPSVAHVLAILALDALTMLFWFAGWISLAVLHARAEDTALLLPDGAGVDAFDLCSVVGNICPTIEAAAIFGAFEW